MAAAFLAGGGGLLGGAAASWPLAARAQDGRTYRIGVLNANPRGSPTVIALFPA